MINQYNYQKVKKFNEEVFQNNVGVLFILIIKKTNQLKKLCGGRILKNRL